MSPAPSFLASQPVVAMTVWTAAVTRQEVSLNWSRLAVGAGSAGRAEAPSGRKNGRVEGIDTQQGVAQSVWHVSLTDEPVMKEIDMTSEISEAGTATPGIKSRPASTSVPTASTQ